VPRCFCSALDRRRPTAAGSLITRYFMWRATAPRIGANGALLLKVTQFNVSSEPCQL